MTSSRDLPWVGKRGRRARHDDSFKPSETADGRDDHARGFSPFRLVTAAELAHAAHDRAPDMAPELYASERELAALFLRRLVTYYARRRRFAEMGGAAALLRCLWAADP